MSLYSCSFYSRSNRRRSPYAETSKTGGVLDPGALVNLDGPPKISPSSTKTDAGAWKRARRQKKGSSQKTNNLRTKNSSSLSSSSLNKTVADFSTARYRPWLEARCLDSYRTARPRITRSSSNNRHNRRAAASRYRGYRSIITINTPARLDRNRMLLTVVIIIATRRPLVVEVGISSSCTLGLQILHRNSRRIYRIRRTGRRRISSKRARILPTEARTQETGATRSLVTILLAWSRPTCDNTTGVTAPLLCQSFLA